MITIDLRELYGCENQKELMQTIQELKSMGNTGIGTFNSLNGELILIDGICYTARRADLFSF